MQATHFTPSHTHCVSFFRLAGRKNDTQKKKSTIFTVLKGATPMADQAHNSTNEGMPRLRRHGSATQLIVDGSPFLVIGGELLNSSSSSIEYMQPIWQRMRDLNINTVLTPVSWELIEPTE